MKLMKHFLTAIIAFSSTLCLAENVVRYKFSGNLVGKQVCRAIVNDDVKDLGACCIHMEVSSQARERTWRRA